MKDKLVMFLPFALVALLVLVNACDSRAQAAPPAARLARQLPPDAAARAAARREYAEAMRSLFRAVGIADGHSRKINDVQPSSLSAKKNIQRFFTQALEYTGYERYLANIRCEQGEGSVRSCRVKYRPLKNFRTDGFHDAVHQRGEFQCAWRGLHF